MKIDMTDLAGGAVGGGSGLLIAGALLEYSRYASLLISQTTTR
jgi:hypothetical protein